MMSRRQQAWAYGVLIAALAIGALPSGSSAATSDAAQRAARQARIESGDDLGSRAQAVLFRARSRQDGDDPAAAARLIEDWLAGAPDRDHALLQYTLGLSRLALDQPEAALAAFRRAVELTPDFARAWLQFGEAAYRAGRLEEAGAAFGAAYAYLPDPPLDLLYYRATIRMQLDAPDDALDDMMQVFTQAPDSLRLDWYRTLAAAALAAGRPDRAQPHLDHLLALAPSDADAWDLVYRFAAGREDYRNAVAYLTLKGHLRPLSPDEHRRLGDLYAAIDIPRQAAVHYAAALPDSAPDPAAYVRLAGAWLAAHEPARARDVLKAGLAAGETASLWSLLGDLEYEAGDPAAALTAFGRSCDLDPSHGRGWLMQGWCAAELGRPDDARRFLERAADFPEQRASAAALQASLAR